ncbi:MAG: SCO family protein [Verrucomicrobiota bacterium]
MNANSSLTFPAARRRRGRVALAGAMAGLLLSAGLGGCRFESKTEEAAACCKTAEPAAAFSDQSLYLLDSTWTNDAGHAVRLSNFQGRVQVLTMFFANCSYACPILVHDMQRIEDALPAEIRSKVQFVLVSFDTERDTPSTLKKYRELRQLPGESWSLLTGKPDDVLELAALLGVNFKQEASGQFAHSNIITILNGKGEIVHQQIGLNEDRQASVEAIRREIAKPSLD